MKSRILLNTQYQTSLTHFMPLISFYIPWKHQKTSGFLVFSGGTEEISGMKSVESELNSLSANPTKWSNTLKQFVGTLLTNCLSVFDHFVKLALKGLVNMILLETKTYINLKYKLGRLHFELSNVTTIFFLSILIAHFPLICFFLTRKSLTFFKTTVHVMTYDKPKHVAMTWSVFVC